MTVWRRLAEFLSIFLPQACVICGIPVAEADFVPLCPACFSGLAPLHDRRCLICALPLEGNVREQNSYCSACRLAPPAWDKVLAWGPYRGDLRSVIRQFKFHRRRQLHIPLSALMAQTLRANPNDSWEAVVPIPPHPQRVRERGFDPVNLLAHRIALNQNLPLRRLLVRTKHTPPLFGLSRTERQREIKGAFELAKDFYPSQRLLLVDDILTTGSTAQEACEVLQDRGAKSIAVLVAARTDRQLLF